MNRYTCCISIEECGGEFDVTEEHQTQQTPNHPDPYPHSLHCCWNLNIPNQDVVTLIKFNAFDLETNYDFLHITTHGRH